MWPLPRQRPHTLHETYQLPRVQLITPDNGHRRCPKHVEFRDKIKFWILDASCWLFMRRLLRCTVTWTQSARRMIALLNYIHCLSHCFCVCGFKQLYLGNHSQLDTCSFFFLPHNDMLSRPKMLSFPPVSHSLPRFFYYMFGKPKL
jgi:hypothetical protein